MTDVQVSPGGAQLDFAVGGASTLDFPASVAHKLLASGFNVNVLRTQDVLRKDEWILLDQTVVTIARDRLILAGDLLSRNLRFDVPNPLGTTRIEWERLGDFTPAEVNMSGVSEASRDRATYDLKSMPFPIIHKDFRINIRALAASRNRGESLDVTNAGLAARMVAEKIDDIVMNGTTIAQTNGIIYGYLNAPNRNVGSVTATWATATGEQIAADVLDMITAAIGANMYGPYVIYVPYNVFVHMGDDYKDASDKTIMQRVMEIPGIEAVRPTNRLTAPNVLLIQMTSDVVDMVSGMQPTVLQWESHGGMVTNFKVMSMMVPRIKDDKADQSGITHFS